MRPCAKERDIRQALKQLPATLDQTYERILANIEKEYYQEAFAIFNWLTASKRPLTLRELAEAAVVQPTDADFDPAGRLLEPKEVLHICGCLITCSPSEDQVSHGSTEDAGIVRFAHYTVQEYFLSGRANRFNMTHVTSDNYVMSSCLIYLQHLKTTTDPTVDDFPLLAYAAEHWFEHCRKRKTMNALTQRHVTMVFGDKFDLHASKWLQWCEPCTNSGKMHLQPRAHFATLRYPGPLFYAVHHDLEETVVYLLKTGVPVNELHDFQLDLDHMDVDVQTSLQLAVTEDASSTQRHIIHLGTRLGLQNERYLVQSQTPLHLAVRSGNTALTQLLLESGADPNVPIQFRHQETFPAARYSSVLPLQDALRGLRPNGSILKALLEHGASTDIYVYGFPILLYSARHTFRYFSTEIASLLLHAGADVHPRDTSAKGEAMRTALLAACCSWHGYSPPYKHRSGLVQLLIDFGANPNDTDCPFTALQIAVCCDEPQVARTLLENGADPNLVGQEISDRATMREPRPEGRDTIAFQLLCIYGVIVDAQSHLRIPTPLSIAAKRGDCNMIELLISFGADVNAMPNPEIPVPLCFAIWEGTRKIVELLLGAGANVDASSDAANEGVCNMSHPILAAAYSGRTDIVPLLIASGASVHPPTPQHQPAITAAAIQGENEILRILIDAGADVNAKGCVWGAIKFMNWSTICMLVEAGADVDPVLVHHLQRNLQKLLGSETCIGTTPESKALYACCNVPSQKESLDKCMSDLAKLVQNLDSADLDWKPAFVEIMKQLERLSEGQQDEVRAEA